MDLGFGSLGEWRGVLLDDRSAMNTREQSVVFQLEEITTDCRGTGFQATGKIRHGDSAAGSQRLQDELVSLFSQHATKHYTALPHNSLSLKAL